MATQKARFEYLLTENNLTIHEKEQFEHYLIAIDTVNRKLLYLNFSSEKEDIKVIDLQKTKTARVDVEENSIYEDKKGKSVFVEKHIMKLQLELTPKDAKQLLPFYQYQDGMGDYNRLKNRIEYWRNNINNFVGV